MTTIASSDICQSDYVVLLSLLAVYAYAYATKTYSNSKSEGTWRMSILIFFTSDTIYSFLFSMAFLLRFMILSDILLICLRDWVVYLLRLIHAMLSFLTSLRMFWQIYRG